VSRFGHPHRGKGVNPVVGDLTAGEDGAVLHRSLIARRLLPVALTLLGLGVLGEVALLTTGAA
jgi:hypothetical protein